MAITRLTLAQYETETLQIMGYAASTAAPWASTANFYLRLNEYLQRLPVRLGQIAQKMRADGRALPFSGLPRFDMWRTQTNMTASSGSSTVWHPADLDEPISYWDNTNKRRVDKIEDVDRWRPDLRTKAAGPPEYIELLGWASNSGTWQRKATLWPATMSGVTPSVQVTYWRIPAAFPGSSPSAEYADIDPKYEQVLVFGVAASQARNDAQQYERYRAAEEGILQEMIYSARTV